MSGALVVIALFCYLTYAAIEFVIQLGLLFAEWTLDR